MPAMPRLPNPLTPDTIGKLMNARPAWDASDPEFSLYRRLIMRGFEIMYPGPTRYDAIGRIIDTPPQPPERIAHLVAKENREMEQMERFVAGDGDGAGGAVHVQSHTRDDGKVAVADYWRARPGEGAESEPAAESTSARNLLDDAENADSSESHKGGADLPPSAPLLPDPQIRGRDGYGSGEYDASRGKDKFGEPRAHKGVDLVTEPGETVRSPVEGTILPPFDPYGSNPELRGKLSAVQIKTPDGHVVEILYVDPRSSGLKPGDKVEIGTPIGKAQDLSPVYPPNKHGVMTNHIDIRVRKDGVYKDPTTLTRERR